MNNQNLVSVIMATYNRSNIIGYAIKTVLNQTYSNWELIVVGDHCTDDTEKVVLDFSNPNIKFHNLPENNGEQSGPNNFGLDCAQGDYITFLNHDDLWFEDHLESLVECIHSTNADLVYSWWYPVSPDVNSIRPMIVDPDLTYNLKLFVPASSWLFKNELIDSVGKWRHFKEIYDIPSQDWIKRVHLKKLSIKSTSNVSMIAIQSGAREKAYSNREYLESSSWYEKLQNPERLRRELLTENLIHFVRKDQMIFNHLITFIWNLMKELFVQFNFKPSSIKNFFRFGRKGAFLNSLRRKRGLKRI